MLQTSIANQLSLLQISILRPLQWERVLTTISQFCELHGSNSLAFNRPLPAPAPQSSVVFVRRRVLGEGLLGGGGILPLADPWGGCAVTANRDPLKRAFLAIEEDLCTVGAAAGVLID